MAVIEITQENFKSEVLESEVPVLVDFWATWCGPCRFMGPVVDEIGAEAYGFKVGKANIDENMDIARQYRVMSVPTFAVFKNGEMVSRTTGITSKEELLGLMQPGK